MNKRIIALLVLLVLIGICFGAATTHDPWDGTLWDVTSPNDEALVGNTYKEIYDLRKGVAIRMNKEHINLAGSSAGGEHMQGSARAFYLATASIPALQPDGTALASTDNGMMWHDTTTNIWYVLDDYSDPTVDGGWLSIGEFLGDVDVGASKFTIAVATGNTVCAGTFTSTGLITANAGVTLGAGDDLIGSSTSDITINTNKFTVAGATGNTLVGGTFDIQGSTAVSGILDEDAMGSDSATDLATQQSIKAYTDTRVATKDMAPATEIGASGSTGVTVFENGFRIGYGQESIAGGAEDTITPSGFTIIYQVTATMIEDDNTDRNDVKIGQIDNTTFTLRNTHTSTFVYAWICVGR